METLKALIAKVLNVEEKSINDASSPESIPEWDSFNALMLVSEIEKNFGVKFTIDEVLEAKNVADIKNALRKHGVKNGLDE
jgi:acyl carrier protein